MLLQDVPGGNRIVFRTGEDDVVDDSVRGNSLQDPSSNKGFQPPAGKEGSETLQLMNQILREVLLRGYG